MEREGGHKVYASKIHVKNIVEVSSLPHSLSLTCFMALWTTTHTEVEDPFSTAIFYTHTRLDQCIIQDSPLQCDIDVEVIGSLNHNNVLQSLFKPERD